MGHSSTVPLNFHGHLGSQKTQGVESDPELAAVYRVTLPVCLPAYQQQSSAATDLLTCPEYVELGATLTALLSRVASKVTVGSGELGIGSCAGR